VINLRTNLIVLFTFSFLLLGCGLPKEEEVSKNIEQGIKLIQSSSWDKSWDKSKNVEDYLHLLSYKYDKKKRKKINKHLVNLEHSISVLDKEKSEKEWKKIKQAWEEN